MMSLRVVFLKRSVSTTSLTGYDLPILPRPKITWSFFICRFKYSVKTKLTPVFNENVCQMVQREEIKARKHPGRCLNPSKHLPDNLKNAIVKSLQGLILFSMFTDIILVLAVERCWPLYCIIVLCCRRSVKVGGGEWTPLVKLPSQSTQSCWTEWEIRKKTTIQSRIRTKTYVSIKYLLWCIQCYNYISFLLGTSSVCVEILFCFIGTV